MNSWTYLHLGVQSEALRLVVLQSFVGDFEKRNLRRLCIRTVEVTISIALDSPDSQPRHSC